MITVEIAMAVKPTIMPSNVRNNEWIVVRKIVMTLNVAMLAINSAYLAEKLKLYYDKTESLDPMDPMDSLDPLDPLDPMGPMDPLDSLDPLDPLDPLEIERQMVEKVTIGTFKVIMSVGNVIISMLNVLGNFILYFSLVYILYTNMFVH